MKKGRNLAILPGGFEEATIFEYNKHKLYYKKKTGFIKYSLVYGYKIVPSYSFGEEQTYFTLNFFENLRIKLANLCIPAFYIISKYGYYPNTDKELITVVGKPIQMP